MDYLHCKHIVHFDLKTANLLVGMRDKAPICKVSTIMVLPGMLMLRPFAHWDLALGGTVIAGPLCDTGQDGCTVIDISDAPFTHGMPGLRRAAYDVHIVCQAAHSGNLTYTSNRRPRADCEHCTSPGGCWGHTSPKASWLRAFLDQLLYLCPQSVDILRYPPWCWLIATSVMPSLVKTTGC